MLSPADLEEIRQGLRDGLRGPILLKWCRQLLGDRDELAARLKLREESLRAADSAAGVVDSSS